MQYVNKHGIDGIATVDTVKPKFSPKYSYFEEGCMPVPFKDKPKLLVVSPDGTIRTDMNSEP